MSDYCIISSKNECRTISNEKQCHVANDVDPEDVNDRKCCVRFASPCIVTLKAFFFPLDFGQLPSDIGLGESLLKFRCQYFLVQMERTHITNISKIYFLGYR